MRASIRTALRFPLAMVAISLPLAFAGSAAAETANPVEAVVGPVESAAASAVPQPADAGSPPPAPAEQAPPEPAAQADPNPVASISSAVNERVADAGSAVQRQVADVAPAVDRQVAAVSGKVDRVGEMAEGVVTAARDAVKSGGGRLAEAATPVHGAPRRATAADQRPEPAKPGPAPTPHRDAGGQSAHSPGPPSAGGPAHQPVAAFDDLLPGHPIAFDGPGLAVLAQRAHIDLPAAPPAAGAPRTTVGIPSTPTPPAGTAPLHTPGPPPESLGSGTAPPSGGSLFVPLAALLALLALAAPASFRRLGEVPDLPVPALFVCALERPG